VGAEGIVIPGRAGMRDKQLLLLFLFPVLQFPGDGDGTVHLVYEPLYYPEKSGSSAI